MKNVINPISVWKAFIKIKPISAPCRFLPSSRYGSPHHQIFFSALKQFSRFWCAFACEQGNEGKRFRLTPTQYSIAHTHRYTIYTCITVALSFTIMVVVVAGVGVLLWYSAAVAAVDAAGRRCQCLRGSVTASAPVRTAGSFLVCSFNRYIFPIGQHIKLLTTTP